MIFLFSLFVVAVDVFFVFAWMTPKCIVLDDVPLDPGLIHVYLSENYCTNYKLGASCDDVSDLAVDLSTVPKDISVLCVGLHHGSIIRPNALTKFHSLKSLYIYGCLSTILPDTFRGLTNLRLLSIISYEYCNVSLPSKVFHDLHNLEELRIANYLFSEMAADVFYELIHMKRLDVKGSDNLSDILCKLSNSSASLEYLNIEIDVETLTTPNCTYGPSNFPSLRNVTFIFPHLKNIGRNAFKLTENVFALSMPMNYILSIQLLQSGIRQIEQLNNLCFSVLNVQSFCEVVLALSVTSIHVCFDTLIGSQSLWGKCHKLEKITLSGQNLPSIDLDFISTLEYVTFLEVNIFGWRPIEEDKSLSSLCKTNASLSSLRLFSYSTEQNLMLRTSQFVCLTQLEELYLQGRNINLEDFVFEGLQHLKKLNLLAHYQIGSVTVQGSPYMGLVGLHALRVKGGLFVITHELFSDLGNVESLNLIKGKIQSINDFAFTNFSHLRKLDLHANKLSKITTNTFYGLQNLETLILDNNPLKVLEPSSFAHFPLLRILHLGNVKFSSMEVLNLSLIFGKFPRQLSDLTITSPLRPMTFVIADDSTPEVGLSLSLSGQKIVIWGCERPFLKFVTKLTVATDFFLCAPDYTVAFGHFISVNYLAFAKYQVGIVPSLSSLNRLVNLKSLDLENINLINQPDISLIFQNLTKLESLGFYQCWLDSLEGELSLDLTSLKYIVFEYIMTEVSFTRGFFEHLTNLRLAFLLEVEFRCTCDSVGFLHWARNQQQAEVFMIKLESEPHQCMSESGFQDLDSYGQTHCSLNVGFVMFVSTSCFLLLFMIIVLLHQLARDYLMAFYHIAHGWLNEALRHHHNTRGRYLYDAFVSYSGRDERWVMEKLLPNLEERGPPVLRLCLHSRDFQLGKDIVENITDSLYRSRRTICLVSRHYLRSNWCSLEMRLGTYRLQVEHRDVLMLVFLEKIPSNLLSAHHRLARLVKTRTYLEWPQDPTQQEEFWDRLWKKLVPDKFE